MFSKKAKRPASTNDRAGLDLGCPPRAYPRHERGRGWCSRTRPQRLTPRSFLSRELCEARGRAQLRAVTAATLLWLLAALPSVRATDEGPYPVSAKRPSFSIGTSVAPGSSLELEFGFDAADEKLTLPTDLRLGLEKLLKRTELSVSFDSIDVRDSNARFGDTLTLGLRTRLLEPASGPSVAFAPEVGIGLRDGVADTLGGLLIADHSFGRHGIVGNLELEAPIDRPEGAPSHTVTWILGYSLGFGSDRRFSAFAEVQQELPQGQDDTVSLMQGITYALQPHFVIDLALQQTGVGSGSTTWQVLAGFTRNFGEIW